jgi:hypothetical protein
VDVLCISCFALGEVRKGRIQLKICKTIPQRMSSQSLVKEHGELNEMIDSWGERPQVDDFVIQAFKRRRCALKSELIQRAEDGEQEALLYAGTREWQIQIAA